MEQNEVVLRAIGILTQSAEWVRSTGPEAEPGTGDRAAGERPAVPGAGQIGSLLAEVFPSFTVSPEATPLEAAHAVTEAALPAVMRLIGAFSYVYAELARVHDSGRTDITSEELLRELALRMQRPADGA
ncbi:hypothetical protein [Streptomyces paludis]|uniref:Uncharacterized protein n=1 Tax=Streptomyces paludis TaxID=2282738 RepID=A0A345HUA1_9ACTN|nr:hypothetical protein [Streptomyces paludis]AXG80275.1 hypothetical protein DVK44_24385 [Streptomyces paludis]